MIVEQLGLAVHRDTAAREPRSVLTPNLIFYIIFVARYHFIRSTLVQRPCTINPVDDPRVILAALCIVGRSSTIMLHTQSQSPQALGASLFCSRSALSLARR